jgi:hypothetical protein
MKASTRDKHEIKIPVLMTMLEDGIKLAEALQHSGTISLKIVWANKAK